MGVINMSSNYSRFSGRTKEQFAEDIKKAHSNERDIIERIKIWYKQEKNIELTIEDNGVDNTGEYLELENVTTDADFKVNGELFEVKYHIQDLELFRMKYTRIVSYYKQRAYIVLVNGYETDSPRFTIMSPKKIYLLIKRKKQEEKIYRFKLWEGKMVIEMNDTDFIWYQLPDSLLNLKGDLSDVW